MPDSTDLDAALTRFTENLREARSRAQLSQQAAALAAGMAQANWSSIELGKNDPSIRTLTKMAAALGTTPAALLDGILDAE